MCKIIFKTILLIFFIQLNNGMASPTTVVPITGRLVNEKTLAPVYKAEVYLLDTDLNVESSETGNFNFLADRQSLPDTITLLIARYEYESKVIRLPLDNLIKKRPTISMARYFRAPEVLNWPQLFVSGKVTDETGKALSDVAIYASATNGHTYSDASGKFSLNVEQMRPYIQPTLWFCKKGYQTRQIGLEEVKKRKVIHLSESPAISQSLTVKYQNSNAELLEAVNVTLNGKILDRTGVLGTVTMGIEAIDSSDIRISHQYHIRANGRLRRASGTVNLDLRSLTPSMTFVLTHDFKFVLAPEFRRSVIAELKDYLPYQDSLFLAQYHQIPEVQLEGLIGSQSNSYNLTSRTDETAKNILPVRLKLPVIDLPEISISAESPTSSILKRHDSLFVSNDSSKNKEVNPRSAEALNRAVKSHYKSIAYCYKHALKKNSSLKGTLELRFVIIPEGDIGQVEIISSSLADPEMEQCIIELMMRWRIFEPVAPEYGNRTYRLRCNFANPLP
jgi:hypothetical protein